MRSWVENVNTACGLSVAKDIAYDDDNADNAWTISSDLSTLDLSDMSDEESNEDISESMTTVTSMSDFTVFLEDSDEDTLTNVTSLSNFTIFLEDCDDEDTAMKVSPLLTNKVNDSEYMNFNISDIVNDILNEMIALTL